MTTAAPKPLKIFCSYSHKDEEHLNTLRQWLRGLERQGLIEWWHDREIVPGWEWEEAIDKNLRTADLILLLVTSDFMASNYVYEKEIDRAIERHERGEARVIPIIVRPSDWEWASFGKLQALPKDAKPITRWPDRDDAWLDVLRGIRRAVEELLVERQERDAKERHHKAVEEIWADNNVTAAEVERLDALASDLSLSADTAADIERDLMGDTREAILERQERAVREKERNERLERLYDRVRELHRDRKWQAVIDVFAQIHSEDSAYPDPEGWLVSAREALEAEERARRVAALYDQGWRHMDAEEWQQALECFEEVQHLKPGYRETERLLLRVQRELNTQPNVVEEALRVAKRAEQEGLSLRLLGGVAIRLRAKDGLHPAFEREYADLAWMTPKGTSADVQRFFEALGYEPHVRFNTMYGQERLLFFDREHDRRVNVLVGTFRMSHKIPFDKRLALEPLTVPLAELLLTKLQIVRLNEKDVQDALALLHDHPVADEDGDAINGDHIALLCASDWGLWRTFTGNLDALNGHLGHYDLPEEEKQRITGRIRNLQERIDQKPKLFGWKKRAKIGDSKRWYELTESEAAAAAVRRSIVIP